MARRDGQQFEIAYAMKVHAYEAKMAEEGNRPPLGTHWSAPSHGTLTPRAEVQRRRAEIMALYDAGTPPQQIAEQLNLPLSVVYNDTYAARMNRK